MAQLVEQRIRNAWVAGSSPAIGSFHTGVRTYVLTPVVLKTHYFSPCGFSSVGRALASQAEGRGFESRNPLLFYLPRKFLSTDHTENTECLGYGLYFSCLSARNLWRKSLIKIWPMARNQSSEFRRSHEKTRILVKDYSQDLIYKQQRAEGPMTSLAQGNTLRT